METTYECTGGICLKKIIESGNGILSMRNRGNYISRRLAGDDASSDDLVVET